MQDGPQAEMANYDATEAALGAPGFRQAFSRMNLSLNQQKIYDDSRDAVWFTWLLPAQYHTRCPKGSDRVAVLPFALDTESWRPTGSVNFSRFLFEPGQTCYARDHCRLLTCFFATAGSTL